MPTLLYVVNHPNADTTPRTFEQANSYLRSLEALTRIAGNVRGTYVQDGAQTGRESMAAFYARLKAYEGSLSSR